MEDFRDVMTEWVELKKQLNEARKDIGVLNKREKELRVFIKTYMKKEEIDNVNVNNQGTHHTRGDQEGPSELLWG
jgi:hypothetical protein